MKACMVYVVQFVDMILLKSHCCKHIHKALAGKYISSPTTLIGTITSEFFET